MGISALTESSPCWLFRVDRVEERHKRKWQRGLGSAATFGEVSLGYFVVCGGVSFAVGPDRPDLRIGDVLELRKRED